MKRTFLFFFAATALISCNSDSENADTAEAGEQQTAAVAEGGTSYTVDTTKSTVTWTGTKPGGAHTGTFRISQGSLSGDSSTITAGNFTINVAALNNQDLKGDDKAKLEGHLKSADFFEADKYPSARFEVTAVQPYSDTVRTKSKLEGATHLVSGNLTLKDRTQNITFPARISFSGNQVTANADFNIDRTEWGMNYKGPNNPQDWFISKDVNIKLNIVATR